jgi:hypothetical protein
MKSAVFGAWIGMTFGSNAASNSEDAYNSILQHGCASSID